MIHNYRPFIFWCQKVLPLVYDDSLSYYEVLCKLVHYLNQLMENMKAMGEDIEELSKRIDELENYVKNYFESADFESIVDAALDRMVEDGTLSNLLEEYIGLNIPISANGPIINALWDTARSYMDATNLAYMHLQIYMEVPDPTPEDPNHMKKVVDPEANAANPQYGENAMNYQYGPYYGVSQYKNFTGYAINCSGFCDLMLLGVPYNNSMYNPEMGRKNKIGSAGYQFNLWNGPIGADNFDDYYRARQMARRFQALGAGFYANADYSNIAPGDVIFFQNEESYGVPSDTPSGITHCAIVLARTEADYVAGDDEKALFLVTECINQEQPIRTRSITSKLLVSRRVAYVGRPAYIGTPENKTYKICDLNGFQDNIITNFGNNGAYMNQYVGTLAVEYVPESVNDYIRMTMNGHTVPFYISPFTKANSSEIGKTIRKYLPFRMNTTAGQGADREVITRMGLSNPGGSNTIIKSATMYYGIYDGPTDNTCIVGSSVSDLVDKLKGKYGTQPNNSISTGKCMVAIESDDYNLGLHHFTANTVWDCEFESGNGYTFYRLKRGRYEALIILTSDDSHPMYTWCNYAYEGTLEELDASLPKYGTPFDVHITLTDNDLAGTYQAIVSQSDIILFGAHSYLYRRTSGVVMEFSTTVVRNGE